MQIEVQGMQTMEFISHWSRVTNDLLLEKGFSVDPKDLEEKVALMHTEVAELTDAFKKGKGDIEEGEEIADIIIRLMNVPCLFPTIVSYIAYVLKIPEGCPALTHDHKIECLPEIISIQNKYTIPFILHDQLSELGRACLEFRRKLDNESHLEKDVFLWNCDQSIQYILIMMQIIITLCKQYVFLFLGKKTTLDSLVDKKMKHNFSRPYRYNTDPALFN